MDHHHSRQSRRAALHILSRAAQPIAGVKKYKHAAGNRQYGPVAGGHRPGPVAGSRNYGPVAGNYRPGPVAGLRNPSPAVGMPLQPEPVA